MPVVLYPGYMEPWSPASVDLKECATNFDDANQVDRDFPDPDAYEYSFETWSPVPVVLLDVACCYYDTDQRDTDDPPPDVFEYFFEPWTNIAAVVLVDDPDYDNPILPNDEDDPAVEFSFEPPNDALTTEIFSAAADDPDSDVSPTTEDDTDPIVEFAFEPGADTLSDLVSDFTDAAGNDDDDAVVEYAFEPWVDLSAATILNDSTTDQDAAQPANDDDDPVADYAFETWSPVSVDTLAESGYIFDLGLWDGDDPPPDPWESYFEPWTDQSIIAPVVWDETEDVDTAPANDDDDPVFDFSFETWTAVPVDTLAESGYIFDAGVDVNADDDPVFDFYFETWTDLSAASLIDAPDFLDAAVFDDDDPVAEYSAEAGADTLADLLAAIDFSDAFFAEEERSDPDFSPDPGIIAVNILGESGYFYDYDLQVEPVKDPDPFEWAFEPWTDKQLFILSEFVDDYLVEQQSYDPPPDPFEFHFTQALINLTTVGDFLETSTRIDALPHSTSASTVSAISVALVEVGGHYVTALSVPTLDLTPVGAGTGLTLDIVAVAGSITSVAIHNLGSGYTDGALIEIEQPGSNFNAYVVMSTSRPLPLTTRAGGLPRATEKTR